jgi:hypothetical protein
MFVSVFGENSGFLAAVNNYLIDSKKLDDCSIKETPFKIAALVIKEASESFGVHFIPCYTLDQAITVSSIGIPVLDIDRIKESMHDYPWGREIEGVDDDTDDIVLAEEIIYRMYKYVKEDIAAEFLPTKQLVIRQPVMPPSKQ